MNLNEYIGHADQLITCTQGCYTDGCQEGTKFISVQNGGDISATVLPGRCLDLYQVRYRGKNINYIAAAGVRNASFYDAAEDHYMRDFYVGQMTTVGLQNIGPARRVYGESQGLHGRIGHTPAENVHCERIVTDCSPGMKSGSPDLKSSTPAMKSGIPALKISGTMREARMFGENLELHREILFVYEDDSIVINDTVTNKGFNPRQFVLLYHINFGYPLLAPGTEIVLDSQGVTPRTEESRKYLDTWNVIEAPEAPYPERVYFHDVKPSPDGSVSYAVRNRHLGIGVQVTYDARQLPYLTEWKMLGKGEYVLGLEPGNVFMDGPAPGEEGCGAPVLAPQESLKYSVKFTYETL